MAVNGGRRDMMAVALFQRIFLSVGFLGLAVAIPYALHQLVVVDTAGDAVIRLSGYDSSVASNKVRPQVPLEIISHCPSMTQSNRLFLSLHHRCFKHT